MKMISRILISGVASLIAHSNAALSQKIVGREELQTDLSSHEVFIETNFNGVRVVIFGAVDNSRQPTADSGFYDVAVSLRGPDESIVARQKQRVAGLWVNNRSMTFPGAPSYYAVLSTRPLAEIAPAALLARYGLGFNSLTLVAASEAAHQTDSAAFRAAVIALKQDQKLYLEAPAAITFVGRSLFRGTFDLPSNVPVGDYVADIVLFSNGRVLGTDQTRISIGKGGVGQIVHATAFEQPFLYGALAVLVAVISGLTGSAIFRK